MSAQLGIQIILKDFDQKNRAALHTKIDLNLHFVKRTFRTVNLLNVPEIETYSINIVVIGLLVTKVFLKCNFNVFIHIFFLQLFLSPFTLYWAKEGLSHHSKIRLCTAK